MKEWGEKKKNKMRIDDQRTSYECATVPICERQHNIDCERQRFRNEETKLSYRDNHEKTGNLVFVLLPVFGTRPQHCFVGWHASSERAMAMPTNMCRDNAFAPPTLMSVIEGQGLYATLEADMLSTLVNAKSTVSTRVCNVSESTCSAWTKDSVHSCVLPTLPMGM